MSSRAYDRKLEDWFHKIKNGELKLPRFQRHEAWDKNRIASLLKTIINDLPLGITLVLEVEKEQFISRYLKTAEPDVKSRVTEHLLDGQQRLTSLWRSLHNNYNDVTYFVYVPELDYYYEEPWSDEKEICTRTRYFKGDRLFPLWVDLPDECLRRGLFPVELLKPVDIQTNIDDWIDKATKKMTPSKSEDDFADKFTKYYEFQTKLRTIINGLRENVKHYNLPYLSLDSSTEKDVALQVFINMNTNSKPLSRYDIIVAEIEAVRGESLHDLQSSLDDKFPSIKKYESLNQLILTTSALLQDRLPNEKGAIEMDKALMLDNWKLLEIGLNRMVNFMKQEGIFDSNRLPTNAVLSVVSTILGITSNKGDIKGQIDILLKKYLWSSFFTDRYENSAASNAFSDFNAIKQAIKNIEESKSYDINSIPVLNRKKYPISDIEELVEIKWPKRSNIRARAILAVSTYLGAYDFADGQQITPENIKERDYHHIFPDSLLKEADLESYLSLNCALITDVTNRHLIGRKDPSIYIKDRMNNADEETVINRLHTHLVPIDEINEAIYEGLSGENKNIKIKKDFDKFLKTRAKFIYSAATLLVEGQQVSYSQVNETYSQLFSSDY